MFEAGRIAIARPAVLACTAALLILPAAPAAAQTPAQALAQDEAVLRSFFEGKRVVVKMDMPGTSDGVDVRIDATRPIDYPRYAERLKAYGTAIRAGEPVLVTQVKVKKDLIEFQLAGGGYGKFGDETSASVYMPLVDKSNREKELERKIKDEHDSHRRHEMEQELDDLRDRRERENRRIESEKRRAEARKAEQIAENRLHAGSRFNLRYGVVPPGVRPEQVMAVLAEYVDFSFAAPPPPPRPDTRAVPAPPPPKPAAGPVMPRKGMTRAEAERAFGKPLESSERKEGGLVVTTLVFASADQHISAEFVGDVLVRYSITSK